MLACRSLQVRVERCHYFLFNDVEGNENDENVRSKKSEEDSSSGNSEQRSRKWRLKTSEHGS